MNENPLLRATDPDDAPAMPREPGVLERWSQAARSHAMRIRLREAALWRPPSSEDGTLGVCKVLSGAVAVGVAPFERHGASGWGSDGWLPPWQQSTTPSWSVQALSPVELMWYPGPTLRDEWVSRGAALGEELLALQHRWWRRFYGSKVARLSGVPAMLLYFWWSIGRPHQQVRYWNHPIAHQTQANLLGLSRSEVTRQLQALKKKGWLVPDEQGWQVSPLGRAALREVLRESADVMAL